MITSIKHPVAQEIRRHRNKQSRDNDKVFLLEDIIALRSAIKANWPIKTIIMKDKPDIATEVETKADTSADSEVDIKSDYKMSTGILKKIYKSGKLPDYVAIAYQKTHKLKDIKVGDPILILDSVNHAGNIGTIIRSAIAFCIDNIIIIGDTDIYARNTIRGSREAFFNCKFYFCEPSEILFFISSNKYNLIATSSHANTQLVTLPTENIAIVLGNESTGVQDIFIDKCDHLVKIPQSDKVESLNVAVAASIMMYNIMLALKNEE
jgi:RNA methyltransferase, TrmH family